MSSIGMADESVSRERVNRLRALVADSGIAKDDIFAIIARDVVDNSRDHEPLSMACALPHAVARFYMGIGFGDSMTPTFAMATVGCVLGFLGYLMPDGFEQWQSSHDAGCDIRAAVDRMLENGQ